MSRRSTGAQVLSKLMGEPLQHPSRFSANQSPTMGHVFLAKLSTSALTLPLAESVQPEVGNVYDLESWTVYYLIYKPGWCDPPGYFLYSCTVLSFFSVHLHKDRHPWKYRLYCTSECSPSWCCTRSSVQGCELEHYTDLS